jgi:hypothetical protein
MSDLNRLEYGCLPFLYLFHCLIGPYSSCAMLCAQWHWRVASDSILHYIEIAVLQVLSVRIVE